MADGEAHPVIVNHEAVRRQAANRRMNDIMVGLGSAAAGLDIWIDDGRTIQRALSLATAEEVAWWTTTLTNISASAKRTIRSIQQEVHPPTAHDMRTEAFRRAVGVATATLGAVSAGAHRQLRMMQSYLHGERRVTPDAAQDLVRYLRQRVDELNEAADRLEESQREEEDNE